MLLWENSAKQSAENHTKRDFIMLSPAIHAQLVFSWKYPSHLLAYLGSIYNTTLIMQMITSEASSDIKMTITNPLRKPQIEELL